MCFKPVLQLWIEMEEMKSQVWMGSARWIWNSDGTFLYRFLFVVFFFLTRSFMCPFLLLFRLCISICGFFSFSSCFICIDVPLACISLPGAVCFVDGGVDRIKFKIDFTNVRTKNRWHESREMVGLFLARETGKNIHKTCISNDRTHRIEQPT